MDHTLDITIVPPDGREPVAAHLPAHDPAAPVPEAYDLFCESCGYSLLGLAGDRCPECGMPCDTLAMPYARVPWLHRRRLGRWNAYWQTVRQVILSPSAFTAELCRPVRISAEDARQFRRINIHLAAASAVAFITTLFVSLGGWLQVTGVASQWLVPLRVGAVLLGWACTVGFLRLATDMPLFIWKGLPSLPPIELAPLHQYASAPLALWPLLALAGVGAVVVLGMSGSPDWIGALVGVATVGVLVAWVLVAWLTPVALMKAATGCGRRRVLLLAAYLPAHVVLMAVMVLALAVCVLVAFGAIFSKNI